MKPRPNHDQMLAAAAQAASYATAAAKAAMAAVQAVVRAEKTAVLPAGSRSFAEVVLPAAEAGAVRRSAVVSSLGRIHFHCPACRRLTVLSFTHRGKRVSCPKCYTAIRVPDPSRNIPAQNLGRTLHPLLHPEDFSPCVDARRLLPWLIGRLPGPAQMVAAAGAILLLAGTAAMTPLTCRWAAKNAAGILSHPVAAKPHAANNLTAQANEIVREFLDAPTAEAKAAYVIDENRTAPWMVDWYARRPGGGPRIDAVIAESGQGFSAVPGESLPVTEVTVESPGEPAITYLVEHRAEGPRIAWPESVGYSPIAWRDLVREPLVQSPVPLRVLACRDDYYNYAFSRESDFCCVRLHDPQTMELLGFGYLPRTPSLADTLAATLPDAAESVLTPVMLAVLPGKDSHTTQQVQIIGPVMPGWKTPQAATFAAR